MMSQKDREGKRNNIFPFVFSLNPSTRRDINRIAESTPYKAYFSLAQRDFLWTGLSFGTYLLSRVATGFMGAYDHVLPGLLVTQQLTIPFLDIPVGPEITLPLTTFVNAGVTITLASFASTFLNAGMTVARTGQGIYHKLRNTPTM